MASFSTVSLMRESPEVIRAFVEYYRRAGALEIMVYYDGSAPDLNLNASGATLVECDDAFWANLGGERPATLEDRQSAIYAAGLARCRSDWLLVVDADEFVFGNRSVRDFLDEIPGAVEAVGVPTAEAVWGPGDNPDDAFGSRYFRLAWPTGWLWRVPQRLVFGRISGHLRYGLAGHVSGKEFLRVGCQFDFIGNHFAVRDGKSVTRRAEAISPSLGGMYLGHYDAIDFGRWTKKWRSRIDKDTVVKNLSGARSRQMHLIACAIEHGEDAVRMLFARFYGLSRLQFAGLSLLGLAFRRDIFAIEPRHAEVVSDRGMRQSDGYGAGRPTSPTIS